MFLYLRAGYWRFSTTMEDESPIVMRWYKNNYPDHQSIVWKDMDVKAKWNNRIHKTECERTDFVASDQTTLASSTSTSTRTSTTEENNLSITETIKDDAVHGETTNLMSLYIGGIIAVLILFLGFVLGFIFIQYPYCKISNWFGSFLER
eukprot:GFUD01095652.1.p1 GENE.GFUD01095652.1~~GFUD01095652.1.p1  ORF type:complete len:161 (-),score=20.76 GFUD01095652.1:7-453(-)